MKYCSECGAKLTRQWIIKDRRDRYVCSSCGLTHYENPHVTVNAIVYWANKVLMCQRAQEPALGQWTVPSGFLESGETLEEGTSRETFEETGVLIDPAKFELYSVMNMTAIDQVAVSFRAELSEQPALRRGPECLEVAFMSEEEVPKDQFAWRRSMADAPRTFFEELRSGVFSIHLIKLGSEQGVGFRSRQYQIRLITTSNDAQGT